MEIQQKKYKGFTLLEIMVVVAIIALMSVTVTVGFSGFGEKVKLQETGGILKDTLKKLELETLEGHHLKNFVHFEPDYLVVESDVTGQTLDLAYVGFNTEKCPGEAQFNINTADIVTLIKLDELENTLEGTLHEANSAHCIQFQETNQMEWEYQLINNEGVSKKIRFIHFNLASESVADPIKIIDGTEFTLSIEAPYAKKQFYTNGTQENGEVILTLENSSKEQEEINLN